MTLEIFDANGNKVSGNTGICARCGAHIKYIFTFDGKTYGSECIEVVTGIGKDYQVFNGKELDIEASKAKKVEKEQRIQDQINRNKALDEKREGIRQANRTRYAELISFLSSQNGDFCKDMARTISNDGFSTELVDMMSQRAWYIIREIWAKQYGRTNSKKYNAGLEEFDQKFCGE